MRPYEWVIVGIAIFCVLVMLVGCAATNSPWARCAQGGLRGNTKGEAVMLFVTGIDAAAAERGQAVQDCRRKLMEGGK